MATKTKAQLEAELKRAQERVFHLESRLKSVKFDKDTSRESANAFRLLFENHPVPMWIYDLDTLRFLEVNDAAIQKYGYTHAEFLALTIKDIRPAEDVPQLMKNVAEKRAALADSGSWRHKLKDGRVINVEITSHTLEYDGHKSVLVMAQNVTERKQAEAAQRESDERFHSLINRMMDGVYRSKHEGRFVDINPAMVRMFGYSSKEEMMAVDIKNELYFEPEERGSHVLDSGHEEVGVYRMRRKDGSEIWVEDHGFYIHDEQGRIKYHEGILRDITERKRAEQVLAESEARFRQVIAAADAIPYSRDYASNRYTFTGEETTKLAGYSLAEITPVLLDSIIVESIMYGRFKGVPVAEAVRLVREGNSGVLWQCEHRIHTRSGEERWITDSSIQILDDNNIPTGSAGIFQDITDRKQIEAAREGEARYRGLFEDSPVSLWEEDFSAVKLRLDALVNEGIKDFEAYFKTHPQVVREYAALVKILNVNKATLKLFGAKSKDDLTQSLSQFADDDPIELFQNELISIAQGKTEFEWEGVNQTLDGRQIVIQLSLSVMPAYEDTFSKVIVSMVDITERKLAEEKLRESEERFTSAFEDAAIGMAITALDGRYLKVNQALCALVGYSTEELVTMRFQDITHPEDLGTDLEYMQKLLEGALQTYHMEKRYYHKLGELVWVLLNVSLVRDHKGGPFYLISQAQDITKRKRAEAERNRRVSELEALYENGLLISQLVEPKKIAQKMVDILADKLNWHHAAVRLYHSEDNRMELLALSQPGLTEDEIEENIKRLNEMLSRVDRGLSGWVIRNKFTVRSGNLPADPRYIASYPGMHSGLYVPLQTGNTVLGSIAVETEAESAFSEQDERLLVTLATQASIAISNAQLYLQAQKELQERRLIEEEIRQLNTELENRVEERTTEIESTRQRLELAAKAAGLGIWEWNITTGSMIWDAQMHRIYGTSPEIFDGTGIDERLETFLRFVHPDDRALKLQISESIIKDGKTQYQTEYRIIKPDGQISYLSDQGVAVFSPNGTLERIIGIVDDITLRKKTDQALHESETYARLLFDAAPDAVSVSEIDGTIIDVNNLFEQLHQVKREEIRGRNIYQLGIYPPEDMRKRREYIQSIMQGGNIPPVELDFFAQGDQNHTLEMHSYQIEVQSKPLVLSTYRDITVHKKAEETLRLANAEMERALRIKDEFLASMSHELRTPLNAILGISESLEEQIIGPLNEKQLKYLRTINESGQHLHELINDILDLSKIEAGRMDLNIMDVPVAHLCESSMRMVRELAQKKGLNFSISIDPQVKTIKGDDRRLKQTLVNLLSNAVKFTPAGKEIGLELQGHPETSQVTFTVWDHGIGIATEDTDRLFKPFVQLDSSLSREYAGTGLGLALVAQMVRLHGGNVSVESELGKGSRFIVTLPWVVEEENPQMQIAPEDPGSTTRPDQRPSGRVLIVEDTHTVASLMKEYLENKGYEVFVAHNGMEGVTLAKKKLPDLILMDVMMPVMDGMEATRQIRADKSLENIPVIALTALAMPGDRERCFAAGMSDYLSKPIHFKELLKVMDRHTALAKSEKQ